MPARLEYNMLFMVKGRCRTIALSHTFFVLQKAAASLQLRATCSFCLRRTRRESCMSSVY